MFIRKRSCVVCGHRLRKGRRRHVQYCGNACKQKAYRRRLIERAAVAAALAETRA